MKRRELLRTLASAAALAVVPDKNLAAAWTRVASGIPLQTALSPAHLAVVRAIADTIIPRTNTPGATDVGVHKFVDVIVNEHMPEAGRVATLAGLDAIDARARTESNVTFAELSAAKRSAMIDSFEQGDRNAEPSQTYWRLKGLVVHGYFTSERVMKDVLKVIVMPGKFEGAAPVTIKRRPSGTATPKSDENAGAEGHAHA